MATDDKNSPEATALKERQRMADNAIVDPSIPHLYFNEFGSFFGGTDFLTVLAVNGRAAGVLHMSSGIAKSLALELLGLVTQYEKQTGREVLTLEQANTLIQASQQQTKAS